MPRTFVSAGLVWALLASGPADAQSLTDAQRDEARGLFDAGRAAFEVGRYPEALGYFERAYEITRAPELLYNVAQSADRLRDDARALAAFQAYLDATPEADERPAIEARIRALNESIEERRANEEARQRLEADAARAHARPPRPPPAEAPSSPAGWILAGSGGAAAVAGAILLAVANVRASDADAAPEGTLWTAVRGAYADADSFGIAGGVLLGVGLALAAGGIAWGILASSGSGPSVAIGPGRLELRGRF